MAAHIDEKDEKHIQTHVEDIGVDRERGGSEDEIKHISTGNRAADNDAANYVNPNVVITEEMNTKMRRRVHKRYVSSVEQS